MVFVYAVYVCCQGCISLGDGRTDKQWDEKKRRGDNGKGELRLRVEFKVGDRKNNFALKMGNCH